MDTSGQRLPALPTAHVHPVARGTPCTFWPTHSGLAPGCKAEPVRCGRICRDLANRLGTYATTASLQQRRCLANPKPPSPTAHSASSVATMTAAPSPPLASAPRAPTCAVSTYIRCHGGIRHVRRAGAPIGNRAAWGRVASTQPSPACSKSCCQQCLHLQQTHDGVGVATSMLQRKSALP